MPYRTRRPGTVLPSVRSRVAMAAFSGLLALTLLGPAMTMLDETESSTGNIARQAGYALVFILSVVAMRPIKYPERLAVVPWPFWVALAWCWLSLAWALDPAVSVRRLVLTTIIIWSVFAAVRQLGIARTLLLVRGTLVIALVANFIAVFVFPNVGVHYPGADLESLLTGRWRGILAHKNVAGLVCAATILLFLFDRRKMPYALVISVSAFALVFLWFSESKTSFGLVFLAAAVGWLFPHLKSRLARSKPVRPPVRHSILIGTSLALFPLIHFGVQSEAFLNYLSDGSGLTGRAEIWAAMMRYYLANPIFSAGYGSFWNISNANPIATYGYDRVTGVTEGHNGFLELLVTIGLPGLVLVLVATVIVPISRLLSTDRLQNPTCALIAALLFFCIGHNFTESSLFDRDSIGQVLLLIALAMLWTGEEPAREASRRRALA